MYQRDQNGIWSLEEGVFRVALPNGSTRLPLPLAVLGSDRPGFI